MVRFLIVFMKKHIVQFIKLWDIHKSYFIFNLLSYGIVWYRIVWYRIVSYSIVSYRIYNIKYNL